MHREDLDALIGHAQEGDIRAFEALVAGHLPLVRRFARAFAVSDADADDLAQEALVRVYKHLRLFRYQASFSSWLYALVRNAFLDAEKGRAGTRRTREEPLGVEHEERAGGVRPDDALERAQDEERLWRALRQVPIEFRSAVVLFDIEGCTYDEVATIEGVAVGTVKSRLHRGRAHLRGLLEAIEPRAAHSAGARSPPGTDVSAAPSHLRRGS